MKKAFTRYGLHALLLAAWATLAGAQVPPAGPETGPGAGHAHERHDPFARLKTNLQLQPAQEQAWATWTAAMAPQRHDAPPPAPAATTPERLQQMHALRQARDAEEQRRETATLAFYATLSAEQKKVFDQAPPPPPPGRPGPHERFGPHDRSGPPDRFGPP
jgi:hypothetical protein